MPPLRKKAKPQAEAKEPSSESETSDSGPEDRNVAPAKKKTAAADAVGGGSSEAVSDCPHRTKPQDDGNATWQLSSSGKERFLKISEFKGKTYVNLREYYEKDGKLLPGKAGIALTLDQWKRLGECVADVNAELAKQGHT